MIEKMIDKWKDFIGKKNKGRPNNDFSYGDNMSKITIRLPKTVYAQLELVNLKDSMEAFPYDFDIKMKFINKILPLTTYLDRPVDLEILGYDNIETLITLYCDVLLAPLSQRAQEKMTQTIEKILETNLQ